MPGASPGRQQVRDRSLLVWGLWETTGWPRSVATRRFRSSSGAEKVTSARASRRGLSHLTRHLIFVT